MTVNSYGPVRSSSPAFLVCGHQTKKRPLHITAQKAFFGQQNENIRRVRISPSDSCRRVRLRRYATACDKMRRFSGVTAVCDESRRSATTLTAQPHKDGGKKHRERNIKGCLTALPDSPSMSGVLSDLGRSTEMPWRLAFV